MKHRILITLTAIFITTGLFAQNCEAYIPTKIGEKHMYQTKNKKGKIESYYSQELISKKDIDDGSEFNIRHISYDDKKEIVNQDTLKFLCKDNVFYIDMGTYLNEEQMGAYDESQIEITYDNIGYPADLKPGSILKDGFIKAEINVGMILTFITNITNRTAEAYEDITTEAGTFKTIKVTEDIDGKFGFVKMKMSSISWVKMNIGNIRTESYDKKGNLSSVSELISIE